RKTEMNGITRPLQGPDGRFLPGNPGGGRTLGSRNKLAGEVLDTFLADFKVHGAAALVKVREERPSDYWRIATQLLPNEVLLQAMVSVEPGPLDGMSPDEMRSLLSTIRALRAKQIDAAVSCPVVGSQQDGASNADK